jgi:hypothetical protein
MARMTQSTSLSMNAVINRFHVAYKELNMPKKGHIYANFAVSRLIRVDECLKLQTTY